MANAEDKTEDDVSIKTLHVIGGSFVGFRECHTCTSHKDRDNE
jgi:hypothetical protein